MCIRDSLDAAREKLPTHKVLKKERVFDEETGDVYKRQKYSIIYADPPWAYRTCSKKGQGRSAESHYPTMCIEDIKAGSADFWEGLHICPGAPEVYFLQNPQFPPS